MTVFIFIVILAILVFVHELGHFSFAKYFKIRVDEFALGFPPRILSKKIGETRYSLNIVPFGGYVKIFGEDPDEKILQSPDAHRSIGAKNRAVQAIVLAGGVLGNIIFAWLLLSSVFMSGAPVSASEYEGVELRNPRLLIIETLPDSPATQAGILSGDEVLKISDGVTAIEKPALQAVRDFIFAHDGKPVTLSLRRGDAIRDVTVTPRKGVVAESAGIGISMDVVGELKLSFTGGLIEGAKRTYLLAIAITKAMGKFIYDAIVFNASFKDVAGPVGIAVMVGDVSELGFSYLLTFTALISLNLAIINLIPFPALDGGRLFFLAIEAVIRRPLPPKLTRTVNALGFMLLLLLLVVVTYKDLIKLIP